MYLLTPDQVNYFHILVVAPLLLYLAANRQNTPTFVIYGLGLAVLGGVLYHAMRLYQRIDYEGLSLSYPNLVNLFHLLIVFPILYCVFSMDGKMSSRRATMIQTVAVGVLLYHAYRLYQRTL